MINRRKLFAAFALISLMTLARPVFAIDEPVFGDQWNPFYKKLSLEEPTLLPADWRERIDLPPPPGHAFSRTEAEAVFALKKLRRRYQKAIDVELKDVVHPFIVDLRLSQSEQVALRAFWKVVVPNVTRVHMHFKAKFDRARPKQYLKKISPSIDPPGHPAYPSGHSTDSHTLALLLSTIWPERKTRLLSIAYQVALNREIGGVHFRSDTVAGMLLAQQIVALLPRSREATAALLKLKNALL